MLSPLSLNSNNSVEWDEIKDNIRKTEKGVVGSGHGYTLLHAFVQQGNFLAVNLLLEMGIDINAITKKQAATPLHLAILCGNLRLVQILMDRQAQIDIKDKSGRTELIIAAECKRVEVAKMLIDFDANLNAQDNVGVTPLIAAVRKGSSEIAYMLLEAGADVELKDKKGETPLFAAAKSGEATLVSELLEIYGAEREKGYPRGAWPADIAAQQGHVKVVELLQTAPARKRRWYQRIFDDSRDRRSQTQLRLAKKAQNENRQRVRGQRRADYGDMV